MLAELQLPPPITRQLYCCFAGAVTLFCVCVCPGARAGARVCERDADEKAIHDMGSDWMVARTASTLMK